jgi:hypothetical protein
VDVDRRWDFIAGQFELRLRETAAKAVAADAPANTKACFKYGRPCIYLDVCPHKKKKESDMKLSSLLSSTSGTVPTPAPAAPVYPKITPQPAAPVYPKITPQPAGPVAPSSGAVAPIVLYFGGSFPMRHRADTLHVYMEVVQAAVLREVFGAKYNPDEHFDIIAVSDEHPSIKFGKWKALLGAAAKEMLPSLTGGHYLVSDEERIRVVANAILPMVHAVGGPRF